MTETLFVSGTGTGVGKTFVTRGLARALAGRGTSVAALKPIETGCDPDPMDAIALARASGRPELAQAPGLYRAAPPVAPYAATLAGADSPPSPQELADAVTRAARDAQAVLVEGAGGLLVPIDSQHDMTHLVRALDASVLLVAADGLGVLSHVLTAFEAASYRGLEIRGLVLASFGPRDRSVVSNLEILRSRLPCPVFALPACADDDDALAAAVQQAGLLAAFFPIAP